MRRRLLHRLFDISISLKLLNGILEAIGGLLLFFIRPERIMAFVSFVTARELLEDPNDFVAQGIIDMARQLSVHQEVLIGTYVLLHGLVNILLVIALWRGYRWAYPLSLSIFSMLALYVVYLYIHTHSALQLLLIITDIVVIGFIWAEWRRRRH